MARHSLRCSFTGRPSGSSSSGNSNSSSSWTSRRRGVTENDRCWVACKCNRIRAEGDALAANLRCGTEAARLQARRHVCSGCIVEPIADNDLLGSPAGRFEYATLAWWLWRALICLWRMNGKEALANFGGPLFSVDRPRQTPTNYGLSACMEASPAPRRHFCTADSHL